MPPLLEPVGHPARPDSNAFRPVKEDPNSARSADVKTRFAVTAAVLIASAVLAAPAAAQNPAGANAPKYGVAVVDISFIFKQHTVFRQKMDRLKDRMKGIESQLEGDRTALIQLEQQKKQFKPESSDFIAVDEKMTKMKADLQIKMTRLRTGFLEDEASAYYETYQQVSQTIAAYAKHYKIALVVRFNGEKATKDNRQSIIAEINKPVQFQDAIDITPDILALVNQATRTAAAGGAARQ